MDSGFLRFLIVALAIWGVLHAYVFWRIGGIPWVAAKVPTWSVVLVAIAFWASYLTARMVDARGHDGLASVLEPAATTWVGLVFILFSLFLIIDLVTLGGRLGTEHVANLRLGAVALAVTLAALGTLQALRAPVVRQVETVLPGMPAQLDGTSLLLLSDLHLGSLLGETWLERVVDQVDRLKPDLVVIAGDLADHDFARVEALLPTLSQLRAPHGVWAVTGNHDAYAGLERMQRLMRAAGFHVLEDEAVEALPGLTMAGIDDLSVPRKGVRSPLDVIETVLESADTSGGVIFLSHTPLGVELAAEKGAGLMLCGHTHGGQIWPFNHLVRVQFKHVGGRYQVGDMTLIVCRGTGTWGPRMRLWRPSEMWQITLRAETNSTH